MKNYTCILFIVLLSIFILQGCAGEAEGTRNVSNDRAVEASDVVVTIEGRDFTTEDMKFYTLMQKVKNELNRIGDAEGLNGEKLDESNAYWEAQNLQYDNINVQLQNMIEIYAMSLLGKEKNYFVPVEKLEKEIEDFNSAIASNELIQGMIQQFGEKNYMLGIRDYTEERMLRDRVADEINKMVREENPNAIEQEVKFLMNNAYDELYEDHVSQLELVIHLK